MAVICFLQIYSCIPNSFIFPWWIKQRVFHDQFQSSLQLPLGAEMWKLYMNVGDSGKAGYVNITVTNICCELFNYCCHYSDLLHILKLLLIMVVVLFNWFSTQEIMCEKDLLKNTGKLVLAIYQLGKIVIFPVNYR